MILTHICIDNRCFLLLWCTYYRGDVTVKRDSRLDSLLESEGDTEDDEETDGTDTIISVSHTLTSLSPDSRTSLVTVELKITLSC